MSIKYFKVGIYNNYFFVSSPENSSLLIFSASNLSESFTVPYSRLFNRSLYSTFSSNIYQNGLLWIATTDSLNTSNPDTRFLAFSAQDLLDSHTSTNQKAIKIPYGNFNPSPFNGTDLIDNQLSGIFVSSNHLFSLQLQQVLTVFQCFMECMLIIYQRLIFLYSTFL